MVCHDFASLPLQFAVCLSRYTRPSWSAFELGKFPVWWQASDGQPPAAGGQLIIFFNPDASSLKPNDVYGVAFNGGFNQPIMCGGEPRIMTKKDRGNSCAPLYSIKINLPKHTLSLEFSFTNGKDWDGPYKLNVAVPPKFRNKPSSFFSEGLAAELSKDGACDNAIYPEAVLVMDRCPLPPYNPEASQGKTSCDLDLNPGCTDKENPFYDPLATVDDGTCPYVEEQVENEN
ncbi:hypothetical protein SELMODRAFT_127024 [Selaginella moellendorffii]|uniref:PIFI-like Ig-like domain-containing protein n=1 Tax=Selaginella moellendorffii TaxID=88036 RepID=D8SX19_SELML|nr:hypothetical protein SELMODRAFT_127024 [Selaginella moellendorffii]